MDAEVWKEVPSFPGVKASSIGRVLLPETTARGRTYKTKPVWGSEEKTATGRADSPKRRIIRIAKLSRTAKVHRLVCEAFHGPAPSLDAVVLHLNENASDNRADNLRWGTRKENQNFPKAVAAFKARTGENSPWAIHQRRKSQ